MWFPEVLWFTDVIYPTVLGKMVVTVFIWGRGPWSYSSPGTEFENGSNFLLSASVRELNCSQIEAFMNQTITVFHLKLLSQDVFVFLQMTQISHYGRVVLYFVQITHFLYLVICLWSCRPLPRFSCVLIHIRMYALL